MNLKVLAAGGVLAVFGWGCGGGICSKVEDAMKDFNTKAQPCSNQTVSEDLISSFKKSCEANEDEITDAQERLADQFVDCIDKLETCSPATSTAWASEANACLANVQDIDVEDEDEDEE